MLRRSRLVLMGCLATVAIANADERPYSVGRLATADEIRAWGISVPPDGTGLPIGRGNATEGRLIYQRACAGCHGDKGKGNAAYPPLVGGRGTLTSENPVLTVGSYWPYATTIWDYINRAMPYTSPGTLKPNKVYAVTAYLLFLNNIVGERKELNRLTLPKVLMPNRNGFTTDPRPDVP
jgi:S-disulfanyl-L-cysteine oxidoreductase SoxD